MHDDYLLTIPWRHDIFESEEYIFEIFTINVGQNHMHGGEISSVYI